MEAEITQHIPHVTCMHRFLRQHVRSTSWMERVTRQSAGRYHGTSEAEGPGGGRVGALTPRPSSGQRCLSDSPGPRRAKWLPTDAAKSHVDSPTSLPFPPGPADSGLEKHPVVNKRAHPAGGRREQRAPGCYEQGGVCAALPRLRSSRTKLGSTNAAKPARKAP